MTASRIPVTDPAARAILADLRADLAATQARTAVHTHIRAQVWTVFWPALTVALLAGAVLAVALVEDGTRVAAGVALISVTGFAVAATAAVLKVFTGGVRPGRSA